MIKVAMISFWHVHAKDYAKQATNHPDTEIVAVWDEIAVFMTAWMSCWLIRKSTA
jgi:hypothetical protein